jgi:molybdate transport system substrate-binding protein
MTRTMRIAATGFAAMFAFGVSANAAEIKVLSSNALKSALEEIAPQFEKASGHKVVFVWGAAVPLRGQIEKGEIFDATILNTPGIDALISQGQLDSATRTPLVRSSIGVAVRKGAPKPDISTTEAFKTALRNAKSITYVEQGASGIYLKELFVRIGIADEIKSKIKPAPTAAAEFVAKGEAEIGMTQISEILPFAGADLVGPLPADIQLYTSFAGANSAATKQLDAGKALLNFLVTPDSAKVMKAKGLEPAS